DISKNFHYSLRTGGNMTTNDRKRWYGMSLYQGMNNNGLLAISDLKRSNWTVENLIMYNGKVGDWLTIDATAGVTYDQYYYLNENTKANQFTFFDLRENGLSVAGNVEHPTPDQKDYQLLSYLARVNLSFLDKYLVTASFRADGSSKFAKGNRWGYFPSASVAWRMEQEPWLKDVDAVSQLKLRLSFGVTGNQSIDPYTTISQYGQLTSGDVIYADPNGNGLTTMIITNLSNSSLKWEKTSSWNFGVDFGFFKHRLDGTIDLYAKKTSDLLISRTLPGSAGYASTYYNQGGMSNKGFEITLTGVPIDTKDWTWQISGNIGLNRAKITDLGLEPTDFGCLGELVGYYGNTIGDHFGIVNIFLADKAPGLFYGYQTQGIVQYSDLTSDGVAFTKPDGTTGYYKTFEGTSPAAGDIKFVDQNGDGVVDTNDRTIIGDPNPDFTYGFSTKVAYKNLSLSISFNGVQGVDRYNTNNRYINTPSQKAGSLTKTAYLNMWRDDAVATNYSTTYPSSTFVLSNCSMDRYVEDASYLRCSDITLSYTFPKRWMKQIGFYGLNLSFSAKNAFIITKYSGYDPEVNSFAFDGLRPGIDMNSYPNPRSFILSVNITF
ncbi:MAG: SusC/RagA family TonB-linked outer membrane protein, partial [Bacteroidales bacterium]|nr:SusC/RagA family TonB-linked outer membrane protein [Bacteroidales bacterium]